jgi:hypothetical protein
MSAMTVTIKLEIFPEIYPSVNSFGIRAFLVGRSKVDSGV